VGSPPSEPGDGGLRSKSNDLVRTAEDAKKDGRISPRTASHEDTTTVASLADDSGERIHRRRDISRESPQASLIPTLVDIANEQPGNTEICCRFEEIKCWNREIGIEVAEDHQHSS